MDFIKIGYNDKGELLSTVCKGKPITAGFFYECSKGEHKEVKDAVIIELNSKNLQKILKVVNDS